MKTKKKINPTKTNTKKKVMLQALEKSLGVVTPACMDVGINRETHYRWLAKDENYRKQVEDIENIAIDFVESKLYTNIKNGDTSSTIFYLKTKGKKRGYIERQDITLEGNISGSINIDKWIKENAQ